MIKIAIVYHSGYGHTEVQAQHVHKGANAVDGVSSDLISVKDLTDLGQLDRYDGIVFGSPTYMGSVSAPFKAFMDASSAAWFEHKWKNKVAAGFTNSLSMSGDKLNTLVQICVFAMQHGMIWVGQAEMNQSTNGHSADPNLVNRMGSFLGAMAQSDNDKPEVTPPAGDLKTAELLGKRVAETAKKFT